MKSKAKSAEIVLFLKSLIVAVEGGDLEAFACAWVDASNKPSFRLEIPSNFKISQNLLSSMSTLTHIINEEIINNPITGWEKK